MPVSPLTTSGKYIDLSSRLVTSATVATSPTGATITTIANLTLPSGVAIASGVLLFAQAQYTVGTNGVSVQLDIKRSTTVVGTTGAVTQVATQLGSNAVWAFDTGAADGQAYVLAMTVASGSTASTVSSLLFGAILV